MPRIVLLAKAQGAFKHSGKYYLLNGRWHKLHEDKPAPKGAPIAAHPHAAGQHVPKQHFSDDEWQKLKLPAENTNAGSFNKLLDQLKEHSDAGNVTAILGMQFGTNTYGKKGAAVANHLLGLYGSEHKVSPGQKAGEHAAVSQAQQTPEAAPDIAAPAPDITPTEKPKPKIGPVGQALAAAAAEPAPAEKPAATGLAMPAFVEGKTTNGVVDYYEKQAQKILDMAAAGDVDGLAKLKHYGEKPNAKGKVSNTWAGKTANSKTLLSLHAQAMENIGGNKPVAAPEPEAPGISPDATVGPKTKKILDDLAASGDKATLQTMAYANKGHNPHIAAYAEKLMAGIPDKPAAEPSAAEKVKQATQAATAAVAQDPGFKEAAAIAQTATAGDASSKLAQIPWDSQLLPDSNTNAKSHNGKVAQIKAMAEAGDLAGLEAFKAGKNTYGQKQMKLAAVAIAALKESAPQPATPVEPPKTTTPIANLFEAIDAAGNTSEALAAANTFITMHGAKPDNLETAINALEAHGFAIAAETIKQDHGLVKLDEDPLEKLENSIAEAGSATDAQKIAAEYVEAGGHTPMAYSDAVDALQAGGWPHTAKVFQQAKEIAEQNLKLHSSGKPSKPDVSFSAHWNEVAENIDNAIDEGDIEKLQMHVSTSAGLSSPGARAVNAYAKAGLQYLGTEPAPKPDDSPKEGDTKQGADGMLVFKGGRWHKQEQPETAEQHPIDAVPMPELTFKTAASNATVKAALETLKQQIKDEGPGVLKGLTKHMKANGKYIVSLPGKFGYSTKVYGYEHAPDHAGTKVYDYVEALKVAAGKPKKAAAKAKAAAPVYAANGIQSMDSWKQTGPQGGSNPGGKFKDENGVEWYCKFPGDEDVAKSEVLAAQLYAIAGVAGQDAKLVLKDGKLGIASKWTTVSKASPADLAKTKGVLSGFGVDAWLGNWDVVGLAYDNLQVNEKGEAVRVDAGGSLTYRAQGGKKAFGTTVSELDSLRDSKINPQAASVFGKMSQADITAAVAKVLAIPNSAIINAVEMYGPGDAANKKALADVLLARKADLAAKFPKAVKPPKKRLDPNSLPVDADRLPKAHDFENWLGAGKPLSSQPHVNAANMAIEQEMLALAKTGNLTKLKEFKFHAIDKATGNATGQMIPIDQHPSKHVVQLHADLVMTLDEIANPPEPLKVFQETDVGTIEQLSASLPPKKFGTTVGAVQSNEKLGFWVVLGTAHGAKKFAPAKVMDYSNAAIAAAKQKFQQASHLAKHFILSVQASGSYNDLFRNGKSHDHQGNKLTDVANAALEHATSMPEGTSIYRWQSMPDDMVKKILDAPDGTVFQATGPMCTSYHPTGTSGFGKHRVTVRYAKGAKAVESFASGKFAGEKEVTTLPNSRFVILKKEMVPDVEHGNPGGKRLELEVLMLPPDLGM